MNENGMTDVGGEGDLDDHGAKETGFEADLARGATRSGQPNTQGLAVLELDGLGTIPTRFDPLTRVASTGSTNADLLTAAAQGAPSGAVLVADYQRAARGRQRRTWVNEPGQALMVSVLLRPRSDLVPLISIIAGLAVIDTVQQVLNTSEPSLVGLKWPNDVLVPAARERKLAGILTEATTAGGSGARPASGLAGSGARPASGLAGSGARPASGLAVIVGTGVNVVPVRSGQELTANAISLAEVQELAGEAAGIGLGLGPAAFADPSLVTTRNLLLGHYLRALDSCLGDAEANGPEPTLARYRSHCLTLGRQVRFETPSGIVDGLATDLAPDGALVLETASGREVLTAGDAHHVPAPGSGPR